MRKSLFAVVVFLSALPCWAGDYLFLSKRYLSLTEKVLVEADKKAPAVFPSDSPFSKKWGEAVGDLRAQINAVQKARLLKKLKPEMVTQTKNEAFAASLNRVKDGLNAMSDQARQPLADLVPSYREWTQVEARVVSAGLEQRLESFETRYGPESEQINVIEFLIGEAFLKGNEGGPGAWEPIARVAPVQATTAGAVTSTAQLGANYYFVNGSPKGLGWVASNHVGLAATLQYLEDPRVFRFRGKPCFGLQLHLDKKEVGFSWDQNDQTFRMTLGYALQFIPLAL